MTCAKWLEYRINENPDKPGRRQEVFDLRAIEHALGAPLTHAYSNQIEPGATAGAHYHKTHKVAMFITEGEIEMTLEDLKTHDREVLTLRPGNKLLLIPTDMYHAATNKTGKTARAIMFATSAPRDPSDDLQQSPVEPLT